MAEPVSPEVAVKINKLRSCSLQTSGSSGGGYHTGGKIFERAVGLVKTRITYAACAHVPAAPHIIGIAGEFSQPGGRQFIVHILSHHGARQFRLWRISLKAAYFVNAQLRNCFGHIKAAVGCLSCSRASKKRNGGDCPLVEMHRYGLRSLAEGSTGRVFGRTEKYLLPSSCSEIYNYRSRITSSGCSPPTQRRIRLSRICASLRPSSPC